MDFLQPAGLVGVAPFFGLYRIVLIIVDARLQDRIEASSRATVSCVAGMGTEISVFGIYAFWAIGGIVLVAALVLVMAGAIPRLLRSPPHQQSRVTANMKQP